MTMREKDFQSINFARQNSVSIGFIGQTKADDVRL